MKNYFLLLSIAVLLSVSGCKKTPTQVPVSFKWEMGENHVKPNVFDNTFYVTNTGDKPLNNQWVMYFNQEPVAVLPHPDAPFTVEVVSGTYYKLYPSANYKPIAPGETVALTFRCTGNLIKQTNAPEGAYVVPLDENGNEAGMPHDVTLEIVPYTHEYQWSRKGFNEPPYPYGDIVYEQNEFFAAPVALDKNVDIIPSVKEAKKIKGATTLSKNISINAETQFENEAGLLAEKLQEMFSASISDTGETTINLKLLANNPQKGNDEYYEITTLGNTVDIAGVSPHAVFNGCQTLLAIIGNYGNLPCEISSLHIKDYPDLAHRGQMIDICRNYTTKENLLKLIDAFSMYKLNVLHLHITDDEGWRIEIPGLPELTEIGSRRGHTLDESDRLYPAYGGGWNPDDPTKIASGYYTREDFIEVLKYAQRRHVKLLPEVDLPGHARAAIKAMNARYKKYIDTDPEKAKEYLLVDFDDASKYSSAQWYTDNVINAALPSTYTFVQKVIDEIYKMYQEAGVEFDILHMGGDEIPHGAWEGSPIAQKFAQEQNMGSIRDLKDYFFGKVIAMLNEKNIQLAGWQEVVLMADEKTVNPLFADNNVLTYCWNTVMEWGSGELPYQLANSGYPVILCSVTNLYMDLSYNKHQMEPGLYWGGFVDEYVSYDMLPYNIYKSLRKNMRGEKVDLNEVAKGKTPLKPEARKQIKGIQGQLWAETIRSYDMVQYSLFPKTMGLMERGWNAEPAWSLAPGEKAHDDAIRLYNAKIAENELPRFSRLGLNFRIAQPGIVVKDGKLYANSTIPKAIIRYTTDGSEPNANSPVWTEAVDCTAPIVKAKAYFLGKESVTTLLVNE